MSSLITLISDILPALLGTFACFLLCLFCTLAFKVCHGTIKTYLADVGNVHIISGYKDPFRGWLLLEKILRGIFPYQESPHTMRILLALCSILCSACMWNFWQGNLLIYHGHFCTWSILLTLTEVDKVFFQLILFGFGCRTEFDVSSSWQILVELCGDQISCHLWKWFSFVL